MMTEEQRDGEEQILEVLYRVGEMLKQKNAAYGDSALEPLTLVRDVSREDKLKRWRNRGAQSESEDVLLDLIGYLLLAMVVEALDSDLPSGCADWRVDIRKAAGDHRFDLLIDWLHGDVRVWQTPGLGVFSRKPWGQDQQEAVLDFLFQRRETAYTSWMVMEALYLYVMLYPDRVDTWCEESAEAMS